MGEIDANLLEQLLFIYLLSSPDGVRIKKSQSPAAVRRGAKNVPTCRNLLLTRYTPVAQTIDWDSQQGRRKEGSQEIVPGMKRLL